jgi:hypothetical protein
MTTYYAEVQYTTNVIVRVTVPDGEEPTDEDIWEAISFSENHLEENTFDEQILSVEKDDHE